MTATAGSWGTTFKRGVTGAINVVETNGATLQITGVQLEVGSRSTPFNHENYGATMEKCQRYYMDTSIRYHMKSGNSGNWHNEDVEFPVRVRVNPTCTLTTNVGNHTLLPTGIYGQGGKGLHVYGDAGASYMAFTADAEL